MRLQLPLAAISCILIAGCNRSERVLMTAHGSGTMNERLGVVTYTDGTGKSVTTPTRLLPWQEDIWLPKGQNVSVSVRGVSPHRTYSVQIEVGPDANNIETKASNSGPGGQDVRCFYPADVPPIPPVQNEEEMQGGNAGVATQGGPTTARKLRECVLSSNLAGLKSLVEGGADVNAQTEQGNSALTAAAEYGQLEIAKYLLEKGANINLATSKDNTPLIFAAWKGQTALVQLLCEKGADVNARTRTNGTALTFAASGGKTDAVRILISHKADVNARQDNGGTPYKLAVANGFPETAQVIRDAGGQ